MLNSSPPLWLGFGVAGVLNENVILISLERGGNSLSDDTNIMF